MKVLFMGTPEFAKISLECLVKNKYNIAGVVTQPDKPAGRKMILTPPPVKEYASSQNIPVYQPQSVKGEDFFDLLKSINPDIIVVVAYGKLIPKNVLDFPKHGCVNVHGSLLPKYRGASPINAAIINGDKITGITTIYMDEGIDTGDMILKESTEIGENETFGEVYDRLAQIGGKLLSETLNQIKNGTAKREKQPEIDAPAVKKINNDMCEINWNLSSKEIHNKIRGLSPSPTAFTWLNGKKLKIYKSEIVGSAALGVPFKCGEIITFDKSIEIKAGNGIVKILELQLEGAKKMSAKDFLNGKKIEKGTVLDGK
jgi:methionyl-tRNA formyltransferase